MTKKNGIIVSVRKPKVLAEAIIKIIENPKMADAITKNGRKTVCEKFSFDNRMKMIEKLYEGIIKK